VAVPWPYRIEHGLTQGLMHGVTALTVIVLGWVDILASQHGNVIEVSTGVVGINEACSGIRSFQSLLMGALFLGELYRLRWPHRLALIGSGVVVAFGLNVVRTFILTWCASDAGIELVGKWHDPAGLSIFLASFACLWLLARRLEKHCAALDEAEAPGFAGPRIAECGVRSADLLIADCGVRSAESGTRIAEGGLRSAESEVRPSDLGLRISDAAPHTTQHDLASPHPCPSVSIWLSAFRFHPSTLARRAFCFISAAFRSLWSVVRGLWSGGPWSGGQWSVVSGQWSLVQCSRSLRFMAVAGVWSLCIIGVNELWYRAHDLTLAQPVRWWVSYPTNLPSFHAVSVPEEARKILKYDQCATAAWNEADGASWSAYCFRWRAGDPTARMSALGHRPEYCLTGSGHELKADLGTKYIRAAGLELPFRGYIFEESQRTLYVFLCLWEDGAEKQAGFGRSKYSDRLRSVLAGRRGLGQQTMEVAINGCTTMADAERAFQQRLPELVRLDPAQPSRRAKG
jgi:exosortase/archaeosortase family protein